MEIIRRYDLARESFEEFAEARIQTIASNKMLLLVAVATKTALSSIQFDCR